MKNTYLAIILLVILGFLFVLYMDKDNTIEAPVTAPSPNPTVDVNVNVEPNNQVVKEFTITAKNFSFSLTQIKVKQGERIRINFVNSEGFHDLNVDGYGVATRQFKAPGTETIEFTADKAGSFEYYCSVGSHRAMGMKGTLVVE